VEGRSDVGSEVRLSVDERDGDVEETIHNSRG
jgi:hypothetical protein